MDSEILSVVMSIVTIVTVVLSVKNSLDSTFAEIKREMHSFAVEQSVDSAVWKEKVEHLEYLSHSNKNLIDHRTDRLLEKIKDLDELTQERQARLEMVINESRQLMLNALNRQEMSINDIQRFLVERQGFNIRQYGDSDRSQ